MKIKSVGFFVVIFLMTFSRVVLGQSADHSHHHHEDHDYEIGLSLGLAKLEPENETAFSTHLHLMKRLVSDDFWNRVALGVGIEYIFTEQTHYSLLGTISYNPTGGLIIDIAPGILITKHEDKTETHFITHIEFTYEFDFESFGFGPVAGIAWSQEDKHYMIGIHFGKGM